MPQRHGDFQTVTVRHEQVCDYEINGSVPKLPESFTSIGRIHNEVPGCFQYPTEEGTDLIVVVNEEDGARIHYDVFPPVARTTSYPLKWITMVRQSHMPCTSSIMRMFSTSVPPIAVQPITERLLGNLGI